MNELRMHLHTRIHVLVEGLPEDLGSGGCQLRGLDDDGVSGRDGAGHRHQAELDREVPRADDEDEAVRLSVDESGVEHRERIFGHILVGHVIVQAVEESPENVAGRLMQTGERGEQKIGTLQRL